MAGDFSNLTLPTNGADFGTWGTELNLKLTDYDTNAFNKSATASTQTVSSDVTFNTGTVTFGGTVATSGAVSETGGNSKIIKSTSAGNVVVTGGLATGGASSTSSNTITTTSATALKVQNQGSTRTLFNCDTSTAKLSINGKLILTAEASLTISSGSITVSGVYHQVDTESLAASDDLTTILGGQEGQLLVLRTVDSGRDVVVKDGVVNLFLAGDCTLGNPTDCITLFSTGANWMELSRSINN